MRNIITLSKKKFLESFRYAPRPAISLIIKKTDGEFLLAKRSYAPLEGKWYLPGSFLLKNEHFSECAQRVSEKELGFHVPFSQLKLKGVYETLHADSRGHIIDIIYEAILYKDQIEKLKPEEHIKFFANTPQENMYAGHGKILKELGYK